MNLGLFGGIFGGLGAYTNDQYGNAMAEQEALLRQAGVLIYNPQRTIPAQYYEGMTNNIRVSCAYCRTPRMSAQKECKGCGASEVMA